MSKMNVCELIGCAGFNQGHCTVGRPDNKCPPRKAVADGLVEALENIEKHEEGCLRRQGGYDRAIHELATEALSQIEGGKG